MAAGNNLVGSDEFSRRKKEREDAKIFDVDSLVSVYSANIPPVQYLLDGLIVEAAVGMIAGNGSVHSLGAYGFLVVISRTPCSLRFEVSIWSLDTGAECSSSGNHKTLTAAKIAALAMIEAVAC